MNGGSADAVGRGQGELVGLVLVFGLVIAGATTVVVLGASAIGDSQEELSTQRAEKVLTQIDSKAALVALENTDVQSVSLPREDDTYRIRNGSGWMNITVKNTSSGNVDFEVEQRLGELAYENGNDILAYQGGGVWRSTGNGSVMISPPEFHFRNGTLTLPIINVTGKNAGGNGVQLRHTETIDQFPISGSPKKQNPLEEHRVNVTIRSDFYQAWGRYFETRTDGIVSYDHDKNKATLQLVSPLGRQSVNVATSSLAASGTFELHGSAAVACGTTVYTNSYNSSGTTDDYCLQTPGDEGHVIYGENVDISSGSGTSNLRGNVVSGGKMTVSGSGGSGQPDVFGHINYTESCNPSLSDCQDRIMTGSGGDVNQIDGVDTINDINLLVEDKVDDIQSTNDNDSEPISSGTLDFTANSPSDEVTLTGGKYYLNDITIQDGETLILDTSSGNITLAVEGGINLVGSGGALGDGGSIIVQGDREVKVYVQGDDSIHGRSFDVVMGKNTGVVTGSLSGQENATIFRMYGRDDLKVHLDGGGSNLAKFVGVIFAPPGRSGTAEVDIDGGEVYGGVITGTTTIDEGSIHYDEALRNRQIISRDAKVVKVTYLHITVNRIHISN